jgi:hypothetical protein
LLTSAARKVGALRFPALSRKLLRKHPRAESFETGFRFIGKQAKLQIKAIFAFFIFFACFLKKLEL